MENVDRCCLFDGHSLNSWGVSPGYMSTQECQTLRGGWLGEMGWGDGACGAGRRRRREWQSRQESLKVMWLIEHQQPQIRLWPFVPHSQCVDGKVTRLKVPGAPLEGARRWGGAPF